MSFWNPRLEPNTASQFIEIGFNRPRKTDFSGPAWKGEHPWQQVNEPVKEIDMGYSNLKKTYYSKPDRKWYDFY